MVIPYWGGGGGGEPKKKKNTNDRSVQGYNKVTEKRANTRTTELFLWKNKCSVPKMVSS